MKLKVFTALFLVLAMMFSVATPVMAAAPIKGALETTTSTPIGASGKYTITITKDKHIKVTVTLSKVTPNKNFNMIVYRDNVAQEMYVDGLSTAVKS